MAPIKVRRGVVPSGFGACGGGRKEVEHEAHEGREGHEGVQRNLEELSRVVVDAGLKVHRALGPGLLESVYERCLAHELELRGHTVLRQVGLPVIYEGMTMEAGFRLDLVVDDAIIIEIKSVEALSRLHEAQILTYLRLSRLGMGFLMNFNVVLFKQGLRRFVQ
jgi:GxxExxY protein